MGALALGGVVGVVAHVGDLREFRRILAGASALWLAPAVLTQLLTYVCAAGVWWRVLARLGHRLSLVGLVPLGVAKLFADQAVPVVGIGGSLLVVQSLGRRGVPAAAAMSALLVGVASFVVAFLLATVVTLAVFTLHHRENPVVLGGLMVLLLAVGLLAALLHQLATGRVGVRHPRVRRWPQLGRLAQNLAEATVTLATDRRLLAEAVGLQLLLRSLDALTLWLVLQSLGAAAGPGIAFAAVVAGAIAATLAPLPMGLGAFEAGATGALHLLDVPIEPALASVLVFRGLSLWLPLVPGFLVAQHELRLAARNAEQASRTGR